MRLMNAKEFLVGILILMPIITLIHEIGHACIGRMFGCRLKRIVIGTGENLFSVSFLEIRKIYFFYGYYESYDIAHTKVGRIMVHLGGALFNLISILLALLLLSRDFVGVNWLCRIFIVMSTYMIIACLLPLTYGGNNSDGKQIYLTVKYGKSVYRNSEE